MRKLVADSLLGSLQFSGNPHLKHGRLFDMKLVRESPTKTQQKWADQFEQEAKLNSAQRDKRRQKLLENGKSQSKIEAEILQTFPIMTDQPKQRGKSASAFRSMQSTQNILMLEKYRLEDVEDDVLIAGQRNWEKKVAGFKSGEERRLNRIQSKLKKAMNDLEL